MRPQVQVSSDLAKVPIATVRSEKEFPDDYSTQTPVIETFFIRGSSYSSELEIATSCVI
jgi:hypothetical protein